ncbi:TPA: glycosyltransferase [Candidatus Micrarchaeota archaeon]|nr:glycosyltransferase [Candidatus Micrarchaeota archaeon]
MLFRKRKLRILLLVDTRDWALHTIARAIKKYLSDQFEFEIRISDESPEIKGSNFDILHVLYGCDTYHRKFPRGNEKVIKGVYGHSWHELKISVQEFYKEFLRESHAVTVSSKKLLSALSDIPPAVFLFPEGVDTQIFRPLCQRSGELTVGWAGTPNRELKRLSWLKEACDGICELKLAEGFLSQNEMVAFYNSIDVIACSSKFEGAPRPLLEGMACGAFPVSFDVGIAPELIDHGVNGILVDDECAAGLKNAFIWCKDNLDFVRKTRQMNVEYIRATRTWEQALSRLPEIYYSVL